MTHPHEAKKGFSLKQMLALSFGIMLLTALAAVLLIKFFLFPQPFQPVVLNTQEEHRLDQKLDQLASFSHAEHQPSAEYAAPPDGTLKPQPYSEAGASREITFTEREINSLLANNTDLAEKLAIDFSQDLVSLRLRLPLDQDFPVLGGKTLRVSAGAELAYRQGRPVVILKGVSLMGIPVPNAWLGGMKNIDLMEAFGGSPGFWQSLGEGLESVQVREGELYLRLRE